METEKITTWRSYFATLIIFVINAAAYILCTQTGQSLYDAGSMNAEKIIVGRQYYRLFTCMFLHADIDHIVSNMIFLIGLGQMVECAIGHFRFLALYLISGFGAGTASLLYSVLTGDIYDAVGASGAIFGLIGALLILVIIHHGRYRNISIGRIAFAIVYMVYAGARAERVDNAAHVGGLMCGMLIMAVMNAMGHLYNKNRGGYRG